MTDSMIDQAAEAAVVGALLMADEGEALELLDVAPPAAFAIAEHRTVATAVEAAVNAGRPFDTVAIASALSADEDFQRAGGRGLLVDYVDARAVDFVAARQYADLIIRELWRKRELYRTASDIAQRAGDPDAKFMDLLEASQKMVDSVAAGTGTFASIDAMAAIDLALTPEAASTSRTIRTGIAELDSILGGLRGGNMFVLGGATSMGKTVGAGEIALNVAFEEMQRAAEGKPSGKVAFFNLEMTNREIGARFSASCADRAASGQGPTYEDVVSRVFGETEYQALKAGRESARGLPLEIFSNPSLTAPQIRAVCRTIAARSGLALVVVDYLQRVRSHLHPSKPRFEVVTAISAELKQLAVDLDVPVLALSQLSRSIGARPDPRPILSDIRESGDIENDADVVAFMFRPAYYAARKPRPDDAEGVAEWLSQKGDLTIEFLVQKNRHGKIGEARAKGIMGKARIRGLDDDTESRELF